MGVCVSTQTGNPKGGIRPGQLDAIDRLSTIKVIHTDGLVEEFTDPIKAKKITYRNPSLFLCNSELMSIGKCVPEVSDEEDLQLGQIYFLMPLSRAGKPLSLPDLCTLAIKASSALRKNAALPSPFFR